MRHLSRPLALSALTLVLACDKPTVPLDGTTLSPIDAALVTQLSQQRIEAHAAGVIRALGDFARSNLLEAAGITGCTASPAGTTCTVPAPATARAASDAASAARDLEERFLSPDQIESSDATHITYRLTAEKMCGSATDGDCVRAFRRVPFRVIASEPADGLHLVFDVTDAHLVPLEITLSDDRVLAAVDLAATLGLLQTVGAALGWTTPLPTQASGRLLAELDRSASDDYTLSLSTPDPIAVSSSLPDWALELGAHVGPIASVRGMAGLIRLQSELGTVDASAPLATLVRWIDGRDSSVSGVLAGHLAGLVSDLTFYGASTDQLRIDRLGFGGASSMLMLDGVEVAGFDLNAALGRELGVSFDHREGAVVATLTRALELEVRVAMQSLQAAFPELPSWVDHDRLRINFSGNAPSIAIYTTTSSSGTSGPRPGPDSNPTTHAVARILAGTLELTSETTPTLSAAEGSCLDTVDGATHPFLAIISGVCP